MKLIKKTIIFLLLFSIICINTAMATDESYIVEPITEEKNYKDDYDEYLENKKKKSDFTIKEDEKDNLYSSRGTIITNRNSEGKEYNLEDEKLEILTIRTDADNELYFIVDYDKTRDNIILLGKTTEQELASMTGEINEYGNPVQEKEVRLTIPEDTKETISNKEDIKLEKTNKFKINFQTILVIGMIVSVGGLSLLFISQRRASK